MLLGGYELDLLLLSWQAAAIELINIGSNSSLVNEDQFFEVPSRAEIF